MRISKEESLLCAALEHNVAEEALARRHYYELIERFANLLTREEMIEFEEIIAEELKHSELLSRMVYRRTQIEAE